MQSLRGASITSGASGRERDPMSPESVAAIASGLLLLNESRQDLGWTWANHKQAVAQLDAKYPTLPKEPA